MQPLPSDDDPKNEQFINIPIQDSDSDSDYTVVVDNEPIYKWCLIYIGIFAGLGTGICLLVYFLWH